MVYWKGIVQMALYILLLVAIAIIGVLIIKSFSGKSGFRSEEVCTSKRREYERRGFGPYGGYPNYGM
jgi:hypothetical protein